jgi:hypothetical protein
MGANKANELMSTQDQWANEDGQADDVNEANEIDEANEVDQPMIQQGWQVNEADDAIANKVDEAIEASAAYKTIVVNRALGAAEAVDVEIIGANAAKVANKTDTSNTSDKADYANDANKADGINEAIVASVAYRTNEAIGAGDTIEAIVVYNAIMIDMVDEAVLANKVIVVEEANVSNKAKANKANGPTRRLRQVCPSRPSEPVWMTM